jgi:lipopolysaccharide transport system ATP-binding protein
MSTVIKVENLSKRYRLGVVNRDMLYKDLQSRWAKFRGKEDPNAPIGFKHDKRLEHGDEFWALRNVDLEVKEGEILGIIGRNGAGKSTLLKILSQITAPTEGRIKVKGRIASLLEVGTGFHPELTGRENVYLNGAILGMTRREVTSKFDEIVAFAEIDDFIDTPVKRYSSGMYVRLAFAVAAHLEPEILIVDEVLAVGDAEFQKKCLGKMKAVSGQGRTVIFVSHNMQAVESLCQEALWMDSGTIETRSDSVREVIAAYLQGAVENASESSWINTSSKYNNPLFNPSAIQLVHEDGRPVTKPVGIHEKLALRISGKIEESDPALQIGFQLLNAEGLVLYWSFHTDVLQPEVDNLKCSGIVSWNIPLPQGILNAGTYYIELLAALYCRSWILGPGNGNPTIRFTVSGKFSDSPYWLSIRPGVFAPTLIWTPHHTASPR